MNIRKSLYQEFIAGHSWVDWAFLSVGLLLQVVVFGLYPDEPIVIVSGLAGVCSVVLCSQGKISSFFFGFLQVLTYAYISLCQKLYGEVAINIFYFVSMIYGVFCWGKQYKVDESTEEASLQTRSLNYMEMIVLAITTVLCSLLAGWGLLRYTDDSQPFLDAFTTVPAIAAQILMVLRFRDQWYYWLVIDAVAAVMWWNAGNYSMMILYVFWCVNCCYGFVNWTEHRAEKIE